ncbi:MAG: UvrD-helicase domain-containing protein [Armatimonadetes bacterium]|nr:UvrD-helicase domain-containing protein [Armatimonadota bacterium]
MELAWRRTAGKVVLLGAEGSGENKARFGKGRASRKAQRNACRALRVARGGKRVSPKKRCAQSVEGGKRRVEIATRLTREQLRAAHTGARRAVVLACAGSGKTRVIEERIAWLVYGGGARRAGI